MRLLLDTHIFLWYISADSRLPEHIRVALQDSANEVYVSIVTLWEMTIKWQTGKLTLPDSPHRFVPAQRSAHGFASLDLEEASVAVLTTLPAYHKDPFDRMLICQALHHGMTLATVDAAIIAYNVPTL